MPRYSTYDPATNTKVCSHCRERKAVSEFSKQHADKSYLDSRCKSCRAALKRARPPLIQPNLPTPPVYQLRLKNKMYEDMPDTIAAYLAGIIDGEASIQSTYPRRPEKPLLIVTAMIHKPTIEWMAAVTGCGKVRNRTNQLGKNDKPVRQAWSISIGGVRAYWLLERIVPFMITKRDEALVGLKLGETLFADRVGRFTDPAIHKLRKELGQRLRDLKKLEWKE